MKKILLAVFVLLVCELFAVTAQAQTVYPIAQFDRPANGFLFVSGDKASLSVQMASDCPANASACPMSLPEILQDELNIVSRTQIPCGEQWVSSKTYNDGLMEIVSRLEVTDYTHSTCDALRPYVLQGVYTVTIKNVKNLESATISKDLFFASPLR